MRLVDADALETVITQLNENGWEITRGEYKLIDNVLFEMPTIEPEPCKDAVKREDVQSIAEKSDWFESSDSFNDFMWALYELPSAQPETHDKRTETHACDLIDRQAAIDALEKVAELFPWRVPGNRDSYDRYNEAWNDAIGRAEIEIEKLPSAQPEVLACGEGELIAQPEIIRCNDCKHWTQTTGNMRGFGLGDCDYINAKLVNCNGFCYWAERRG